MKVFGKAVLLSVLVITLASCATLAPQPTETPVPTETSLPTSTNTPKPTITPTSTPEPTATPTLVPPSPTPAKPTPSGEFEFFNVSLDQADKDTVNISFGFQLKRGLNSNGLQIIANFIAKDLGKSCDNGISMRIYPYFLKGEVSGVVYGADAVSLVMSEPGKCSFDGITLEVIRPSNSSYVVLYKQDFDIPFTLEK